MSTKPFQVATSRRVYAPYDAERYSLKPTDVEIGDLVVVNDTGYIWIVTDPTHLSSDAGYHQIGNVSSSPTFTNVLINGTAGNGYINYVAQSATPAAPASGFTEFADSLGRKSWIRASDGFVRTWDATLTANRVYTLPDASGTVVLSGIGTALSVGSVSLVGTAGAGYASYVSQTVSPAAPASGFTEFADSLGRKSWRRAADGFVRTWDATLTADRVYTLPDASGTLVLSGINTQTGALTIGSILVGATGAATTTLQVVDTGTATPRGISHEQYNNGTNSAQINTRKARGTFATPLTIVSGDILGRHIFWGHDGTAFIESANIRATSTGTIATNRVPSQLEFYTSTNAAPSVLTLALTLTSAQAATLAGNLTFGTSGSILNGTTGSIGITAVGTNQSITLTPSGTGTVILQGATKNVQFVDQSSGWGGVYVGVATPGGTNYLLASNGTNTIVNAPGAGSLSFAIANVTKAQIAASGNLLLGGTVDGTGQLQLLSTSGTSASGITFGTTLNVYSPSAGNLALDGTAATPNLYFKNAGSNSFVIIGGTNTTLDAVSGSLLLQSNNQTALTLDSAQNAAFAGTVKSSGFARVTGDVTNATATMSNLTNLSVTVVAGSKYVGTIQIFANDSTNTDGLAFDLGGGSATFTDLEFGFAAQPAGSTLGTVTSTSATTAITLTVVSTSDAVYTISFAFTCNAGGTVIPRFAQNSHSTGTATVRKNSATITLASAN